MINLVKEFNKTRKCKDYNDELITHVYTEEELEDILLDDGETCNISVAHTDTVKEILKTSGGKVCALNFADGYEPGGLVLVGATTQEEALCRSSNLYESLILTQCHDNYYAYNNGNKEFSDGKSSDRIIYTKDVTFFRDSHLNWLDKEQVKKCDIITCPSPIIGTASQEEVSNRMVNILKVAHDNDVETLILGCWGCGAFGNNWKIFSSMWVDILKNKNVNMKVVFAIMDKDMTL